MGESAFWGFVAASSLILGALITLVFDIPRQVVGLIIGFGAGLLRGGWARSRLIGMWLFIAICSAASAGLGYLYFSGASGQSGSLVLAFSGGAVLAMLAMTMLPEAYEEGGRATGLVTVVGFTLAFFLSTLE
jgi:ZIP family zinc transporter